MKIEPQFARLTSMRGFIEAFWEMSSEFKRQEEAYEAVEHQYESLFGRRKYSSFESFKQVMWRYLKTSLRRGATLKEMQ